MREGIFKHFIHWEQILYYEIENFIIVIKKKVMLTIIFFDMYDM